MLKKLTQIIGIIVMVREENGLSQVLNKRICKLMQKIRKMVFNLPDTKYKRWILHIGY